MTIAAKKKFYVKHFEHEIKEITAQLHIFKKSGDRADDAFLEIGHLLVKTKHERMLDEDVFDRLKAHIAKLMGRNGLRNVNKLVSIAQCDVIQQNKDNLPKDWHLLYLLSKTDYLAHLIASGMISSDVSADIVMKILTQTPEKRHFSLQENEETYTRVDVEKLRFLLASTCWMTTSRHSKMVVSHSISQRIQ